MVKRVSPILSAFGRLSGTMVASLLVASCSGTEAQDVSGPTGQSPVVERAGWQTYTDSAYGFSVQYPEEYVILAEAILPTSTRPPAVQRVRFQDKQIAAGQFADFEPARFSIEVFERRPAVALGDWLRSDDVVPAGASVTPVQIEGAQEALRVALRQQLAPNEFVYVLAGRYVYRLTPLGQHGEDMLASFRLLG
jgi:hypothetical protein